jgi:2,3-bisphosphoglycerate-independent phosphoglycerate mutase
MKAAEITDRLVAELASGRFRHARLNYANGDMVGHTGHLDASVIAMECVDLQLGRLMRAITELRGALIVTADHGNCDDMFERGKGGDALLDDEGRPRPKTSHTLNRVPFYVFAPGADIHLASGVAEPGLANLAATVLQLLGLAAPDDYAPSLLRS